DDLLGPEVPDGVEVKAQLQYTPPPASSITVRLTSRSSSSGIGDDAPDCTAATNAATHARCPLSCRHNRIVRRPGQPKPRSTRKLSSCSTRPAQKISSRSLGNARLPLAR